MERVRAIMFACMPGFLGTAAKIAWRDLRRSPLRSAFLAVAMAVSIAGMVGVQAAMEQSMHALAGNLRAWLAADISISTNEPVGEDRARQLDELHASGIDWTIVTTGLTMAASDEFPDAKPIAFKVVDPAVYPFYGVPEISGGQTLRQALSADTVVVSDGVLDRLNIRIGDTLRVAGKPFRVAATVKAEPDRFAGILGVSLRCILSREGFDRTGVARSGNLITNNILARVQRQDDLGRARRKLQAIFSEGRLMDYHAAGATEARVENAVTFVAIGGFLAAAMGVIGLAILVRLHVEQRMASLAVMKVLGGRSAQLATIFFIQIAGLTAVAFAIGLPLGFAICRSAMSFAGKYVVLAGQTGWRWRTILDSAAAALVAIIPVLAQPLFEIRKRRPAVILRRDVELSRLVLRQFTRAIVPALACAVFVGLAVRILGSVRSAMILAGGLLASIGLILAAVALTTLALRKSAGARSRWPASVRLGLAALYRPGNRSEILIASLATGMMLLAAARAVIEPAVQSAVETVPFLGNKVFILGFEERYQRNIADFLAGQPGVENVRMTARAKVRLTRVNRSPARSGWSNPSCAAPGDGIGPGQARLSEETARQIHARRGSNLEFRGTAGTVRARVHDIRRMTMPESYWHAFTIDCAGVDPADLFFEAEAGTRPGQEEAVRAAVNDRYPTLAAIIPADIVETAMAVARDVNSITRMVSWYVIGSGISVLFTILAASRAARLRETGILSALGARRRVLAGLLTVEFAAIGTLAGLIGAVLSFGYASVILTVIFNHVETVADWSSAGLAIGSGIALAICAGWMATYQSLTRKPMDTLRAD